MLSFEINEIPDLRDWLLARLRERHEETVKRLELEEEKQLTFTQQLGITYEYER